MPQPHIIDTLQAALVHHQAGRWQEAEGLYRKVLEIALRNADALHLLGALAQQQGDYATSLASLTQAVEIDPSVATYHNTLGETLRRSGKYSEAMVCFKHALERDPAMHEAAGNMGLALFALERFGEAEAAYRNAIRINPGFAEAHAALGSLFNHQGRAPEALIALRRALDLNPNSAATWHHLGLSLESIHQEEEALAAFERAYQLDANSADVAHKFAVHLVRHNRISEAKAAWERAISLRPDFAEAHFQLSFALLLEGDYLRGWREHQWRRKCAGRVPARYQEFPQWDGSDLAGRTLLLHSEQGRGDAIQLLRFAPVIAAWGGKVILQCRPELVELARSLPGIFQVIADDDPLPPFDLQLSLFGLPYVLGTTLETIPANVPYLSVTSQAQSRWKNLVESSSPISSAALRPLRIGLVWHGSPLHANDRHRSIPLAAYAPLAQVAHTLFYSLQMGSAASEAKTPPADMPLIDLTHEIHTFTDTAALMLQLDLIISVDTSIVHLAGSLAKPVWALLPFAPDWRWLLARADSPWYPTLRLFRQKTSEDWESTLREVTGALRQLALGEIRPAT